MAKQNDSLGPVFIPGRTPNVHYNLSAVMRIEFSPTGGICKLVYHPGKYPGAFVIVRDQDLVDRIRDWVQEHPLR